MTLYCQRCATPVDGENFAEMRCSTCNGKKLTSIEPDNVPNEPVKPWNPTDRDQIMMIHYGIKRES